MTLIQNQNNASSTTVMIVDDQSTSRLILETIVQTIGDNIKVISFDNAASALEIAETNPPDLILADYKMPYMDGVDFTKHIRAIPSCADIPIIIVTIMDDKSILYHALDAGATDFLTKPVDHYECKVRCRNLLTMRQQQLIIKQRAESLETQITNAIDQIHVREKETLYRLARAGEFKDDTTGRHLNRMGIVCKIIAQNMGLSRSVCNIIEISASMHDIGKIGVPDSILLKDGPLDEDEYKIMQSHTEIGYEILKDSPSPYLKMGALIALHHHEKYNGQGYPYGLKGDAIPIEARIVAVADVFDALRTNRPYKTAWDLQSSLGFLRDEKGHHFDPLCVDTLINHIDDIMAQTDDSDAENPLKSH